MTETKRSAGLPGEQAALSFAPAHPDLPHAGGVAAQAGSESYVEALARVVFYWAYPGVDTFGRTNVWQIMAGQRGTMLGILPGGRRTTPAGWVTIRARHSGGWFPRTTTPFTGPGSPT
jgi:hypothetical protein